MILTYFETVRALIVATPCVRTFQLETDQRSDAIGFLRGDLTFLDDSHLHFREYVRQADDADPERYMYAYHYQGPDNRFIFRYDSTAHHLELPTAPHHKHLSDPKQVLPAAPPNLEIVLREIALLVNAS